MSRIARFVSAARTLLMVQVLASLLAVGVAAWAFVEVRGLAVERDQLKARVAELEAGRPIAPLPVGEPVPLGPDPLLNQLPYGVPQPGAEVLPPSVGPDVNTIVPVGPPSQAPAPAPVVNEQEAPEPAPEGGPARRWDCSGANANTARCRPLMERPNLPLNSLEPRGPALGPRPGTTANQQGPA